MAAKKKSSAKTKKAVSKGLKKGKVTAKKAKLAVKSKAKIAIKSKATKGKTKTKAKIAAKGKSKSKVAKSTTKAKVAATKKPVAVISKPKLGSKPYNKSELIQALAADSGLDKKGVRMILDALELAIGAHLAKGLSFNLHGICKMVVKHKPATPARKGTNPFTGEEMMFKAKPASKVIRIRAFRKLKQCVA